MANVVSPYIIYYNIRQITFLQVTRCDDEWPYVIVYTAGQLLSLNFDWIVSEIIK